MPTIRFKRILPALIRQTEADACTGTGGFDFQSDNLEIYEANSPEGPTAENLDIDPLVYTYQATSTTESPLI